MCNELKVGQLRTNGKRVYEVMCVALHMTFVRATTGDAAGEELCVSNKRAQQWEVVTKYHDFKIDDPVIAVDLFSDARYRAHFARVSGGGDPLVFPGGRTSHTTGNFQPIIVKDVFHV